MIEMPWQVPTPQVAGRKNEKKLAKEQGARLHPGSGSGKIKYDASNEDTVFEMKTVAKSHTLNGEYLENIFNNAARQSKDAVYVVEFTDRGITLEGVLRRS